jgi:hypothetical protein
MRILNQIIPMFFLIQFLVILAGLLAAMLSTSPEVSLPSSRLARGFAFLVSIPLRAARLFCRSCV